MNTEPTEVSQQKSSRKKLPQSKGSVRPPVIEGVFSSQGKGTAAAGAYIRCFSFSASMIILFM